jgi:glutamyl/glutaminyl-tRNA synthetase
MSLILAPDKSKLSKRHGATSVGEFKQQVGIPGNWHYLDGLPFADMANG